MFELMLPVGLVVWMVSVLVMVSMTNTEEMNVSKVAIV
jgi:hypothetical protein